MFATVAAVLFALALIFELAGTSLGGTVTAGTFVTAGLLCLALQLAGVSSRARAWSWRGRR